MNATLSIQNTSFPFNTLSADARHFKAYSLVTFAAMNRVEVILQTETGQEKYRIEEKDGFFVVYKYQRSFWGFNHFKRLAQARSWESALNIIHILN